jgi:hypothetical protein
LLTLIAAGTATAGHLWVARYAPSQAARFYVTHLRFHWQTLTGFTAAQELALAAFLMTGYSAAHTGGSAEDLLALAPDAGACGLSTRIADTTALTSGTHTIGKQLCRGSFAELAAGDAVGKGYVDEQLPMMDDPHPVIVLEDQMGILIRNEVLMGAAGVGRLTVDIRGYERLVS